MKRQIIVPSAYDDMLKKRHRGYIFDLSRKGDQKVAIVYGDTLEEMRELKHLVAETVKKFYAENAKMEARDL